MRKTLGANDTRYYTVDCNTKDYMSYRNILESLGLVIVDVSIVLARLPFARFLL